MKKQKKEENDGYDDDVLPRPCLNMAEDHPSGASTRPKTPAISRWRGVKWSSGWSTNTFSDLRVSKKSTGKCTEQNNSHDAETKTLLL